MATLSSTRELLDDDAEIVSDYFYTRGHTDGLPVIPPTEARVQRCVEAAGRDPRDSLGPVPPLNGEATIEKIAVNAVMAGCKPAYMPLIVAALEAMLVPEFALAGLQPTTNPLTPLLIVNGPLRPRIELNSATGVMGPGWRANATIGRAIRLILLNLGGAIPGDVDKCTQGFVGKYGLCIGENEEESPWEPFHVSRGFARKDEVVTVVGVNASTNIHDSSGDWQDLLKTLTGSLVSPGTANVADPFSTPVIVLNPLHARILADAGFTRSSLQDHIYRQARLPGDGLSQRRSHLRMAEGEAHYLVEGSIPFTNDPSSILIVVAGGMQGGHSCYLPNGHYGHAIARAVPRQSLPGARRDVPPQHLGDP